MVSERPKELVRRGSVPDSLIGDAWLLALLVALAGMSFYFGFLYRHHIVEYYRYSAQAMSGSLEEAAELAVPPADTDGERMIIFVRDDWPRPRTLVSYIYGRAP